MASRKVDTEYEDAVRILAALEAQVAFADRLRWDAHEERKLQTRYRELLRTWHIAEKPNLAESATLGSSHYECRCEGDHKHPCPTASPEGDYS